MILWGLLEVIKSVGRLFSILQRLDTRNLGFGVTFCPLSKIEVRCALIMKKKIFKHLRSERGYSRDYFKPNFRATFLAIHQNSRPFAPNFGQENLERS